MGKAGNRRGCRRKTRLVYGWGINDADYVTARMDGWVCPYYASWGAMICRVETKPSYADCSICEEWRHFSNFRSWMRRQKWRDRQLDKDLIVRGNREYRPDRCCFISPALNGAIAALGRGRGYQRINGRYYARVSLGGRQTTLGGYDTPEEASEVYRRFCADRLEALAFEEPDPRVWRAIDELRADVLQGRA